MLQSFLLMCKEHKLRRSRNLLNRNHSAHMFLIKKKRSADAQYLLLILWSGVQKKPLAEVLQLYLKETPRQMFSCEDCEIFKRWFLRTASGSNCSELHNKSLDSYFFNLRKCLFRTFRTFISEIILKKKATDQFS